MPDDLLWDVYLAWLPEEGRFVYNCRECKKFIDRYGSLVTIDEFGTIESVLWGATVPEYFAESVSKMNHIIVDSMIIEEVFISLFFLLNNIPHEKQITINIVNK